jgi:5-formyltetrahydrofolate cyclo-ligase
MTTKAELRQQLRGWRDALPPADRAALSEQLAACGVAALATPGDLGASMLRDAIVAAYWPLRSEADPRPLARRLAARGATLALPLVEGDAMHFRQWRGDEAELVAAGFGSFGPGPSAPWVVPTLVLVPLLGFDATGQRLGWGKGYYDRYLAHRLTTATATVPRPRAVGIAFAGQQVARIPSEPHDQRLDLVLTERGPVSS